MTCRSKSGRIAPPTIKGNKVPTEHEEQRYFVSLFKKEFKGVRLFAIPNGGKRSITEATRLKMEGVSAGVPDIFIPEWLLWIEMKRQKGGSVDPKQKDWHEYLESIKHSVIVAKGWQEAIEYCRAFAKTQ